MVDERPAPLTLNDATNLSDVVLVDEFVEVDWKKDGAFYRFSCSEKPNLKLRFDASQVLDVLDAETGVFLAKDAQGFAHMVTFYSVPSRYEFNRLGAAWFVDPGDEEPEQPKRTPEEQAAHEAELEALIAEQEAPTDMPRWNAVLDRIVAENTALMHKHGIARKAGKHAKPGSKG
ncbi:hypothetical protein [uncultured Azohydromonas sp.]|jgi:hypothetical protein|uniref:hypothetical protein n=1 Tax=uncultured Azohydromonas sp. TaxID=487342 RepID=UPI00260AE116|nr:hypothetical protein [uncultured Azohydromonas sp.]